jgi:hypothetical protein
MSAIPTVAAKLAAAIPSLLRALDDELGEDFSQPARLLMLEADDRGVTFGFKELPPGRHPLDELMGFVAPDEWAAIGAICHGWATRDLGTRPSRAADRVRVRSAHVVTRDGTEVGGFRLCGEQLVLQELVVGMVPDVLRRCLGLPTPPPDFPAAELSAADWLDALADEPAAAPPVAYASWEAARWDVVTGRRRVPDLSASLAAWMDAGVFARWMAATYPRTTDHLATVRRVLPPAAYAAAQRQLRDWGLA